MIMHKKDLYFLLHFRKRSRQEVKGELSFDQFSKEMNSSSIIPFSFLCFFNGFLGLILIELCLMCFLTKFQVNIMFSLKISIFILNEIVWL